MNIRPEILTIASAVARRHDALRLRGIAIASLLVASATLVAASLAWVLRGHAVPPVVPIAIFITALLAAVSMFFARRMSRAAAIATADRAFHLRDGLTSAAHLAVTAPDAPATQLQWQWLAPRLATCDAVAITRPFPRKSAIAAAILTVAATTLCMLPPSDAVLAAQQAAADTRTRVADAKEQLQDLIDELEEELAEEADESPVDMDEFRKLVSEIEETGDPNEAAREFATIERKIREATRKLDQQRDEETLKLAAAELAKAEETEARQLGQKLDAKEFKEAAEQLEKLKAEVPEEAALAAADPAARKQQLDDAAKQVAKARAATRRMAAAGKQRQAARQANPNNPQNNHNDGQQALEDTLAQLDEAAAEMEKNLQQCEVDPNAKPCNGTCNKMNQLNQKLAQQLRKIQARRTAQTQLDQLRQALAQAQMQCQNPGQQPGSQMSLAQQPGGKQAGQGSSWQNRTESDDSQNNGQLAQLNGQHGDGPSLSAVEDADSGTATSSRPTAARNREFTRQYESFVLREDVPESLKLGVRNYFENLQAPANP